METTALGPALQSYQAGAFDDAAARCRAALARTPDDEALTTLLGMAEHAAGRNAHAAEAFRALTRLRPEVPDYWSNLGYMLRLERRYEEAESAFEQALALDPRSYAGLLNYGLLLLDTGRFGAARQRFLDAVEADPDSPEARIYASTTCFECGDARRAAQLIPPPETWPGLDAALRRDLATALIHVGRAEDAKRVLEADATQAGDPVTIAHLAMLHERTNQIGEAARLLDRIRHHLDGDDADLRLHALTVEAALALRRKDYALARSATEALVGLGLPASLEANANFTLAGIADKLGEPDEAMRQLEKAHAFQFRMAAEIAPDIALSEEEPLRIATQWLDPSQCTFADDASSGAEPPPVFIVGFPRSGTTMLEQMLDAHPGFVSMDEQLTLQHAIRRMEVAGLDYPHQLDRVDPALLAALRRAYWDEARSIVEVGPGQTLVDKNPLNLLRLPMIRLLFPSARIVLALRHPCDVLLSCYMQNFRSPAFMVLCSSLERLARSYVNTMESWIHHQRLLRPSVLELRYEETVGDFPAQVERIADFLGIEDRQPLARFSEHAARKAYISTPSYAQVLEPVNTRAVARWHAYRRHFEPVLPILHPVATHWGYDFR